jgi:hypothetical protein
LSGADREIPVLTRVNGTLMARLSCEFGRGPSVGRRKARAAGGSPTGRGTMATEWEGLVMGDPGAPERPGSHVPVPQEQIGVPALPVIPPNEPITAWPFTLSKSSPTLGWHFRPPGKGAPAFVIARRSSFGWAEAR